MKILVACEESQAVTIELRRLGHEAYSNDIIECSGGHPEWHIQKSTLDIMNDGWDMIIAFPPCTHIAVSGAAHFEKKRPLGIQQEAIEFFMAIMNADCEKIAIENPVNIISGKYVQKHWPELAEKHGIPVKATQAIQPYEHGDPSRKKTNLWLKGLPMISATNIVEPNLMTCANGKTFSADFSSNLGRKGCRKKFRSVTYPGIAKAMAEQWAGKA